MPAPGLGRAQGSEYFFPAPLRFEHLAEPAVPEHEAELGEQVQMGAQGRGDQGKEDVDRTTVESLKIDRVVEKAERDRWSGDMQQHRVARVRQGDAVADGGGGEAFAGDEDLQQVGTVDLVGQAQMVDDIGQYFVPIFPLEAVEDPPCLERLAQRRQGHRAGLRLLEGFRRYADATGSRPFEQLRPIEPVLLVDPVGRDDLLLDPAIDGFFRDTQQPGGVFHR
jgi:hypothetical protein